MRDTMSYLTLSYSGHYDILYQADSALNMAPIVNLQYGLSSDYTTSWDNATLGFDMNSSLMAIPNLMQDSSFGMGAPMSPMPSASPAPPSPFRMSPQQDMYQSPMQSHAPISLPCLLYTSDAADEMD